MIIPSLVCGMKVVIVFPYMLLNKFHYLYMPFAFILGGKTKG